MLAVVLAFSLILTVTNSYGQKSEAPPITAKYFYKFPTAVKRVLSESVVGVRVSFQSFKQGISEVQTKNATGFVVGEGVVLTALHSFSDMPPVWRSQTTKVEIYDGENFFNAFMATCDPKVDLAFLSLTELEQNGVKFSKTPVTFAGGKNKQNMPEHFYSFLFSTLGKNIFFPMEFGQYVMETNLIGDQVLPERLGVVIGTNEAGFSGAPLIGPNGLVFGMLILRGDAYTYVTTVEQAVTFLKESIEALKKEIDIKK